jgi:hypothetical protein
LPIRNKLASSARGRLRLDVPSPTSKRGVELLGLMVTVGMELLLRCDIAIGTPAGRALVVFKTIDAISYCLHFRSGFNAKIHHSWLFLTNSVCAVSSDTATVCTSPEPRKAKFPWPREGQDRPTGRAVDSRPSALSFADIQALSRVATTAGYTGDDVRDVMLAAVE